MAAIARQLKAGRNPDRAGLHRENVFDTHKGIRLIISKDQLQGRLVLHVSGSCQYKVPQPRRVAMVLEAFKEVTELEETGVAHLKNTQEVTHFIYPLDEGILDAKETG